MEGGGGESGGKGGGGGRLRSGSLVKGDGGGKKFRKIFQRKSRGVYMKRIEGEGRIENLSKYSIEMEGWAAEEVKKGANMGEGRK